MTKLRGLAFTLTLTCALGTGACKKSEPDIPTFDPLDKVQLRQGWNAGRSIAVSPGAKTQTAHHVQTIASGLHDVDFITPPTAFIPVAPSCKVKNPGMGGKKYLIIGGGATRFSLMKKPKVPRLMTFDNDVMNKLGQAQAASMKSEGDRYKTSRQRKNVSSTTMGMTDVFVTETSQPVHLSFAGNGLYNFNMAPGVRLTGVVIYTDSGRAAVAGIPDHVPVSFVSKIHKATRGCWTRVQARKDATWSNFARGQVDVYDLEPLWKKFEGRVRKDSGTVPKENIIGVYRADHFLIGPAPVRYEDRLPYVAFAGKSVHYMATDHVHLGLSDENGAYARRVLDQYYEAHMAAGKR